ncbi:MAG: hypothetical protein KAT41_07625 [Candidatus Marinimicrobia bacterium]|nr:hypothetical protein [Candidatus Neomarinimicrobiota bacterium]
MTIFKISLLIIALIFLSGCGIYNLANFVVPDDLEFLAVIEDLNTPEKICEYMQENFEYGLSLWIAYSPYQMWLLNTQNKTGDCNDYSCFAVFVANWHGYETYQMNITYENYSIRHLLAIFVENDKYNYSSDAYYYPIQVNTFREIIEHHCNTFNTGWRSYKVFDYEMNIMESEDF